MAGETWMTKYLRRFSSFEFEFPSRFDIRASSFLVRSLCERFVSFECFAASVAPEAIFQADSFS